jgi:hypothetical protein
MLASTILMSPGPNPVNVRLCLGRLKPGPTGPCRSEIGAPTEGRRSRKAVDIARFGLASIEIICQEGIDDILRSTP